LIQFYSTPDTDIAIAIDIDIERGGTRASAASTNAREGLLPVRVKNLGLAGHDWKLTSELVEAQERNDHRKSLMMTLP
jgi:hypothetical protein